MSPINKKTEAGSLEPGPAFFPSRSWFISPTPPL
jgi:hypothetical protein